jgi:hypothetical protein
MRKKPKMRRRIHSRTWLALLASHAQNEEVLLDELLGLRAGDAISATITPVLVAPGGKVHQRVFDIDGVARAATLRSWTASCWQQGAIEFLAVGRKNQLCGAV